MSQLLFHCINIAYDIDRLISRCINHHQEPGWLGGIALGYRLDDQGFKSRQGLGIFLFTTGPTHPPIQWLPGALSLGVMRPRREADHSPPSSAVRRKNNIK
jgi:hypothetical protein